MQSPNALMVARALSDMLAGALYDLARDLDAAGVGIGERLGTLVLAAQAIRAQVWALPLTTDGRAA